eukprot:TRINITY_DN5666_c0_g1_i1.p2 TRINITY_DN5666_c0_g1~~TRINITY_DN5666_c0_g1_i1.p2  ORF type:complete len:139 (+),score=28.50 TRINITY_DN5666_c0_g1_i1:332-748(+)
MSRQNFSTVAAYTLYGFGMGRCCASQEFVPGAPAPSGCGTACSSEQFDGADFAQRSKFEADLDRAAQMASENISWCCHIFCSGVDNTARPAAKRLNESFCPEWSKKLSSDQLKVVAAREVYGFGRSRMTTLVIRVVRL